MAEFKGSIELIDGIKPKNNGDFPLVSAHDVQVDDTGKRLDEKLAEIGSGGGDGAGYAESAEQSAEAAQTAKEGAETAKNEAQALKSEVERKLANGDYKGADGKSAYAYAKDGGYAGTEEEFAEDLAKIGGTESGEPEMVLSANMFDKSTVTSGYVWYRSSAATTKVAQINSFIACVELRGAGTYRFHMPYNFIGDDTYAKRVPLFKSDKTFLKNLTSTFLDTTDNLAYLVEVVISESDINEGAVYLAYDGYEPYINRLMVVKNMEYPSTYIPYGYIEVSTDSGESVNVLTGKTAVFLGDSICAGTTVEGEYKGYGWAGLIGEANKMNWTNYGKNGGTITDLDSVASGLWLSKQADKAIAENPTADYIIFEGGCNDSDLMKEAGLGDISTDYATFDTTTFSGAFESLILKLVTAYPNAKIGYIIPQKMYTGFADFTAAKHRHRLYFDRAVEICQKWGIPVIDLWHGSTLNPKLSNASTFYTDNQHLTLAGYQKITPMIEAWMKDMYVTGSAPASAPANSGGSGIDVTAEVGQTIVVKAVDEHGKPTAWESADYQPRTHWTEEVEILPETKVDEPDEEGMLYIPAIVLVEGDEYTVTYNGVEYVSECVFFNGCGGLGNMPLALGTGDNGQPFVISTTDADFSLVMPMDGSTSVTLSISHRKARTIPIQYIPKQRTCAEITVSIDEFEHISSTYNLRKSLDVSEIVDALYNALPIYLNVIFNGGIQRIQVINGRIGLGSEFSASSFKEALDTMILIFGGKGNIPVILYAYEPAGAASSFYSLYLNITD
jgi:lysophospholipase L1-like esterase